MDRVRIPTVLVVDDSEGVSAAISMLLSEAGFEVESASNYVQAFRSAAQHAYDLLIIDAQLGPDSGVDLADQVLSRRPESRIIIMTGGEEQADVLQGRRIPILRKPFSRQELFDCIQKVAQKAA